MLQQFLDEMETGTGLNYTFVKEEPVELSFDVGQRIDSCCAGSQGQSTEPGSDLTTTVHVSVCSNCFLFRDADSF